MVTHRQPECGSKQTARQTLLLAPGMYEESQAKPSQSVFVPLYRLILNDELCAKLTKNSFGRHV